MLLESLRSTIQLPDPARVRRSTKKKLRIRHRRDRPDAQQALWLCIVLSVLRIAGNQSRRSKRRHFESIGGFTDADMSGQALNLLAGQPGTGIKWQSFAAGSHSRGVDLVRSWLHAANDATLMPVPGCPAKDQRLAHGTCPRRKPAMDSKIPASNAALVPGLSENGERSTSPYAC